MARPKRGNGMNNQLPYEIMMRLGAETRATDVRMERAMEAKLRDIVGHMDMKSIGNQEEVRIHDAQEIGKTEVRVHDVGQLAEAVIERICSMRRALSVFPKIDVSPKLMMLFARRPDNLVLSDETSRHRQQMIRGEGVAAKAAPKLL